MERGAGVIKTYKKNKALNLAYEAISTTFQMSEISKTKRQGTFIVYGTLSHIND